MNTHLVTRLWLGLRLTLGLALLPDLAPAQTGGSPFQQFFQRASEGSQRGPSTSGRVTTPRVVVVADEIGNNLVISAPAEQMLLVEQLVAQLDNPEEDIAELRVFKLHHCDPQETVDLINGLFPDPATQQGRSRSGGTTRATAGQTDRSIRQNRVLAVPDLRTSSIIVSAAPELMDQIDEMVTRLDSDPARKQKVFVIPVENTDPTLAAETLRGLFEGQSARTRGTAARTSTGRQQMGSQLNTRATQNQTRGTGATGFNSPAFGTSGTGNR